MPNQSVDLPIPASLQRRIRTLGHGLFRLNEAWQLLAVRLERGMLDEDTTLWIKQWCGEDLCEPLPLPVNSALAATIMWSGKSWQVTGVVGEAMSEPWASTLLLLNLPTLRRFWARALRAQRFGWMAKALPRVWALDTQVLRPGAVIAGLGIASWQELPRLMAAGRSFELLGTGTAQPVDAGNWPGILAQLNGRRLRLREKNFLQPEGRLEVSWKRDDTGRIVLDQAAAP